jgi:DNA-binding transcriptional regulator PaaX
VDVESILFLEARPSAGETDEEIVAGAWDFEEINRLYKRYLTVLKARPAAPLRESAAAERFRAWATQERKTWLEAVREDPLLPERLLPANYLGREAWEARVKTMRQAAQQISAFHF